MFVYFFSYKKAKFIISAA